MRSSLRREKRVLVQLEEPIMDLLHAACNDEDTTYSSYMRKLLLADLIKKGKIDEIAMFTLLTA